jgi:hypothetical protein
MSGLPSTLDGGREDGRAKHDDVEAVAEQVVELLENRWPHAVGQLPRLVDAATLARLLGVSRATVYARAEELGAIRMGDGKRPRLRFDPERIMGTAAAGDHRRSDTESRPHPPRGKASLRSAVALLPIKGGETRPERR